MMIRSVKSYVKRDGRISPQRLRLLEDLNPKFGLKSSDGMLTINSPTVLEIGCGMGGTLLELARLNPQKNYIGIEVHRKGLANIYAGINTYNLTNIRLYNEDALVVLAQCIPDNSLSEVLLYFPDPWPKRRHHKRRIVQAAFIELITQKLVDNGLFQTATDIESYAIHMQKVLNDAPSLKNISSINRLSPTKFEKRAQILGYKIWNFAYKKL